MTAAVAALLADGKTAIRDVYNWRVKETERMKVRHPALVLWLCNCPARLPGCRLSLSLPGMPTA